MANKKYLVGKRAYLSGPIEYDNPNRNWRDDPKKVLTKKFKIDLFDPFADPKQVLTGELNKARDNNDVETIVKIAKGFVRKDLAMVDRADFVIAFLPYKVPTTGTHHEIINSNNAKKPTLLVTNSSSISAIPLWYFGFIPTEFMFASWDALYEYLNEVNNNKHRHNNRWAFIYGDI
jgi:nucleoside 2-deoxyribosyltransferase